MQLNKEETTRILNNNKELLLVHQKVVDKLEQRIATLEKVLASHAKCIGEMREKKHEWFKIVPGNKVPYLLYPGQIKRK